MPSRGGPRTRSGSPIGRWRSPRSSAFPAPRAPSASGAWPAPTSGTPEASQDYREAIELATEAGQGREVAVLHNNLGSQLWSFEGPAASLEVLREGIAYAKARGLTEMLDALTQSLLDALVDTGEHDEALDARRRDGPTPRGERGRVRPHRGPRRAGPDPRPAGSGRPGGRVARVARARRPRDRGPAARRLRPRLGRPRARRSRTGRGRGRAAHRGRGLPRRPRRPSTTPACSPRWCAPL